MTVETIEREGAEAFLDRAISEATPGEVEEKWFQALRSKQRAQVAASVDVGHHFQENDGPAAPFERGAKCGKDITPARRDGAEQVEIAPAKADERDPAVFGGSDHGVRALLERLERSRQRPVGRRHVSSDEHRVAAQAKHAPSRALQPLAERTSGLGDPKDVLVPPKFAAPGGAILGRGRNDERRSDPPRLPRPPGREAREELRSVG